MAGGQGAVGEVRVMPDRLHAFTMAICRADGSSDQEARLVADHLVLANLFGHDSHGVGMMPHYIQNTGNGACVRNHHAKISRDNGAVIVVDGGAGYGQVVAKEAMDIGIERAKKHGVCVVGLKNAHHIGRIGHWGEQCARAGMVSTHWVNVHGHKSLVAPFGGAEPRFTTNPYCTAVPRKGKEPIVLDFATSQVAAGKVRVAHNKKTPMDPGLLIDSEGNATADPGVLYNAPYGAILPFGEHKGSGLALMAELLGGALTGGDGLLADVQVEKATDLAGAIELGTALFEAADADHLAEQEQAVVAGEVLVGHGQEALSRVERSPSGRPSSRALSRRRMILPLRVFGSFERNSISFGISIGDSLSARKVLKESASSARPSASFTNAFTDCCR